MSNKDVRIQLDDTNAVWKERNIRFEALKAKQFTSDEQTSTTKTMDQVLYEAAKKGDVDHFIKTVGERSEDTKQALSVIFDKVSPSGNSLLHVAASYGKKDITQLLAHHFPTLITRKNLKGNTPIYLACNSGMLTTTLTLIEHSNHENRLVRMTNEKGNSPLHIAVMNCREGGNDDDKRKWRSSKQENQKNRHGIVSCLVSMDHEVCYYENKAGKSPLCLAVETGDLIILKMLLESIANDHESHTKLKGKSPVQAAIEAQNLEMVEEIFITKPELMSLKDEKGRSVFHWAASSGYLGGVRFLLEKCRDGAFEQDNKGMFPLHLACKSDNHAIVTELLDIWPDPTEMLTKNGQNILHIAAKSGKQSLLRKLLKHPHLGKLVNETDNDGNTPLHLAAMHTHPLAVGALVWDRRTKVEILNNNSLTPYEIAEERSEVSLSPSSNEKDMQGDKKSKTEESSADITEKKDAKKQKDVNAYNAMMTLGILYTLHVIHICRTNQPVFKNLRFHQKPPDKEYITDRTNSLLVVAVLVAGVAFAAAIQMPGAGTQLSGLGGTKNLVQIPIMNDNIPIMNDNNIAPTASPSPDDDKDNKDWRKGLLLKIFLVFNTFALNLSLIAALALCWCQMVDLNLAALTVWAASILVGLALHAMCLAFLAAIVFSVIEDYTFTWVIVVIEILFVVAQSCVCVPLFIPFGFKEIFIRTVYTTIFSVYFCLSRCFARCFRRSKLD